MYDGESVAYGEVVGENVGKDEVKGKLLGDGEGADYGVGGWLVD